MTTTHEIRLEHVTKDRAAEWRELAEFCTMRGALALAVHCDDVADKLEHEAQNADKYDVPVDPASLTECDSCQ